MSEFYDDAPRPRGASKKLRHFRRLAGARTLPAHHREIVRPRAPSQHSIAAARFVRFRKAAVAKIKRS